MKTKKHKLIIISLHDAQAECSCGGWFFAHTGKLTKEEVKLEHKIHIHGGYLR
jgi:hypothetical protein